MKIETILNSVNLVKEIKDEQTLLDIGKQVVSGFDTDTASRKPWERDIEVWTKLALQISDTKTYPWPNASNVKYPLLATASMQFAARAYPSLVPSNGQVVKCQIVGSDPTGEKEARASRISKHMSYQVSNEMPDWEEDMDKLLLILPILGTVFKKTYWDAEKQMNESCLVLPKDLVVNYWAKSLEDAERVTQTYTMSSRKVKEKQLSGIYADVKLGAPSANYLEAGAVKLTTQTMADDDETTPYLILEQHMFYDLDGDGYAEPYVATVEYASKQVLRLVARFSQDTVYVDLDNNIVRIVPDEHYTKFSFVPNPDGGFYDIGFGRLLGTINSSVDTIINQLIDAGSLSNLQAGFIGKGLRIKMGESRFSPGEWKAVNATGDDLKKQILPLPVNAPNPVLLQLLQYLVQSGKELASVAEIMTGKMPGQNTPATTTQVAVEQGMKVFTAVYKRIFRSLGKEFRKIYKLNARYLNPESEIAILDEPIQQSDYFGDPNDLIPGADPSAVTQQEKQTKAQMLVQLLGLGTLDPQAVTKYMLAAYEIPQAETFMIQQQQPKPDPKAEALQMKAQIDQQKAQADMQMNQQKMQMQMSADSERHQMKMQLEVQKIKLKEIETALEARRAQMAGQATLDQSTQMHSAKMQQQYQKMQMDGLSAKQKLFQKSQERANT
jgi:chaperonin GroES